MNATFDNSKTIIHSAISSKWIISENLLKAMKNSTNGSKLDFGTRGIFNLSGVTFNISLYPNGYSDATRGQTIIYPSFNIGKERNIEAEFSFIVETADINSKMEKTFNTNEGISHPLCTTDDLFDPEKKFMFNGELTIKIDGRFKVERAVIPKAFDGGDLGDCLWNQSDKDFTIVAEDTEIKAHKNVLAARSPVFKAMFESNMKESKENKVIIKDFPFEVVEAGIKLCYYRNLTTALSLENKMLLLQFFDKYRIQELKDNIENFLINEINPINICHIVNCSLLSNATNLQNKCSDFLIGCLRTSKSIIDFDVLDKDFAMNLLKSAFCDITKTV